MPEASEDIKIRRDKTVKVSPAELRAALDEEVTRLRAEAGDTTTVPTVAMWRSFCDNLELVVQLHYAALAQRIKKHWRGAARDAPADDADVVLSDLAALWSRAEFDPLPLDDYQRALQSGYDFAVPAGTDWKKLDGGALPAFYAARPELFPTYTGTHEVPHFARHVLVVTRGATTVERSEMFLSEKIDLLLLAMWHGAQDLAAAAVRRAKQLHAGDKAPCVAAETSCDEPAKLAEFSTLRRKTLQRAVAEQGLLRSLTQTTTIREPFFDDVVVMYRNAPGTDADENQMAPPPHQQVEAARQKGAGWCVEMYARVPFGDLEIVLPHKELGLLPVDRLRFVVLLVTLLSCLQLSLEEALEPSERSGLMHAALYCVLAAGLISRLVTMVFAYAATLSAYLGLMNAWLVGKCVGRGSSAVARLTDEVVEQEEQEVLLGYYVLLAAAAPMNAAAVDRAAESLLGSRLGLPECDFDVDDALQKLVALGLVRRERPANSAATYAIALTPVEWLERHPLEHLRTTALTDGTRRGGTM
jgi:hypothetical protein